jgi:predicted negative regulator of RcsB-dependent stress response
MSEEIKKNNFKIKFLSLIKNNFKKIISFLILLIICLFIYLFYTNVQKKNEIKISEQYTEASIQFKQKKVNESKLLFEDIINKDHRFYSPLALYFIIDNNLENEKEKIIKFFDKILKINSIDEENINLIKIKKAIFLFSIEDEESIIKTLNPVINSDSVWSKMATELISNYFLSKNQKTKANEYIQLLNNKKNK